MKVIIYSSNFAPELTGVGKYNGELAQKFTEQNIETHVITAPPYYPEWRRHPSYRNTWSRETLDNGVAVHRSPMYVPGTVTTCKRLLHLLSFAVSSQVNLFKFLFSRPDVVFVVQPSFFCAPAALLFCALTGAKSVMHIQDFELDAMLGLKLSNGRKRWAIFRKFERFIMRRFDMVSTISYSMLERARSKGVESDRLVLFPNWVDTEALRPGVSTEAIRAEWELTPDDKVVLYAGNIGRKQGLEIVLQAAEALREDSKTKFFIVGGGNNEKNLKTLAKEKNLINLEFKCLQSYERLPQMLAMADVHLVVQRRGAADAVLPSKLTGILAVGGHALVTADADTELGRIAHHFPGVYTRVEPENLEQFVGALRQHLARDTRSPNAVARQHAVEHLNIDRIIGKFVHRLSTLVQEIPTGIVRKNNVE